MGVGGWDNTSGNDAACSTLEISQIGETQSAVFALSFDKTSDENCAFF